jgi:hypothetical protein
MLRCEKEVLVTMNARQSLIALLYVLGFAKSSAFVPTAQTHSAAPEFLGTQRVGSGSFSLGYKISPSDVSSADEEDWDDASIGALSAERINLPPDAPSDDEVESTTLKWIKRVVIGLNLCPFAERPLRTKELTFHTIRGDNPEHIIEAVTEQLLLKRDEIGTSIVICPEFHPADFEEYMALLQFIEQRVMVYFDLEGHVQIAAFHPNFTFDSADDKIDIYTNRSPYPMFHVLRADEVGAAVKKLGGDPGKVWRRNKRLLEILEERIGRLKVVQVLLGGEKKKIERMEEDEDAIAIDQALQQTKEEMDKEDKDGQAKEVIRGGWVR